MGSRNTVTLFLFVILVFVFLARFILLGHAIYGDGIYYWAYTRSIVIDHDLNLSNESTHSYSPLGNNQPEPENPPLARQLTSDKYYPLGTSLTWVPAFFSAHVLAEPLGFIRNGYSDIYQVAVGMLNISFVVIGVCLIWTLLKKNYSRFVSITALMLVIFSTNLIYYGGLDVLNTHAPSFLLCSLAVYLLFTRGLLVDKYCLLMGGVIGLCALIRPQDALFAILFLPEILKSANKLRHFAIFALGALIGYLPQLLMSYVVFGNILTFPYIGKSAFSIFNPHLIELVVDLKRGLLFYCPVYLIGFIGLVVYAKNKKPFAARFVFLVAFEVLLISIWSGWAQGESFGLRMFISLIPILTLGICEVVSLAKKYLSKTAIIVIALIFILQNFFMIIAFHLFLHAPTYEYGELSRGGKIKQKILIEIQNSLSN